MAERGAEPGDYEYDDTYYDDDYNDDDPDDYLNYDYDGDPGELVENEDFAHDGYFDNMAYDADMDCWCG